MDNPSTPPKSIVLPFPKSPQRKRISENDVTPNSKTITDSEKQDYESAKNQRKILRSILKDVFTYAFAKPSETKTGFETDITHKANARNYALDIINFKLRPLMTSEALKIVDVGVFVVRDGVSKGFHVDYQFGLMSEFLHAFGPNPGVMRKLILAYNKIDDDLFMSFGAAIKAGESTVEIKNKKDDWKEYFNTLDIPTKFRSPMFLLLDAFVEFYIVTLWGQFEN